MSRVAKEPVELPQGVEFNQSGTAVSVKGGNGTLSMELNPEVELVQEDNTITVKPRSGSRFSAAISGTTRALLANMIEGVTRGFEKKLELKGVGYRAISEGNTKACAYTAARMICRKYWAALVLPSYRLLQAS